MYFCVYKFEVGINDSIFSGNEQPKVYLIKLFSLDQGYLRFFQGDPYDQIFVCVRASVSL